MPDNPPAADENIPLEYIQDALRRAQNNLTGAERELAFLRCENSMEQLRADIALIQQRTVDLN